jgi:hypothetical protein
MAKTSRRWRQFTLAGLMAVVAFSALVLTRLKATGEASGIRDGLIAWFRPSDEATAIRAAEAALGRAGPGGRYRVTGVSRRKSGPGYLWTVRFGNVPGTSPPTFGIINVDARGDVKFSAMFCD